MSVSDDERQRILDRARQSHAEKDGRILKLRFTVPVGMTDDDIHELGERVVTDLMTEEPVTFDGTEVVDES